MTEATKTLGIRLSVEDKAELSKYLNRESAEAILRQIKRGEIELTQKGVMFTTVNTDLKSVNTEEGSVNTDCDNCPYMNDLNMAAFEEVCEYKGLDRQKALDKCVQMLWR